MSTGTPRTRRSLLDLQRDYMNGNSEPLETLMRAWKGIKEKKLTDPHSFFAIGGYHGEPFRGAGWGNSSYWGGYCQHGNVLFPTWHRAYLLQLEEALRTVPGCENVTLPFWDETGYRSRTEGIPWALTSWNVMLDDQLITNPLHTFNLPRGIVDNLSPIPDANYSKSKDYVTVRYPLSGLVGTEKDKAATKKHNDMYKNYQRNVELLNTNVKLWLNTETIDIKGKKVTTNIYERYKSCLDAPNYTVFSNTTSAKQWYDDEDEIVMPLESPHNSIHLAIGGFDLPGLDSFSPIAGANGDMGENDTAGLDPIFYFHHCFVDRLFWLWQKKHGFENKLDIIPQYAGTNTVDSQGPTPGLVPNSWLTLDTPLYPFANKDGRPYTSRDLINFGQLGYTYGPGSLDDLAQPPLFEPPLLARELPLPERNVLVSGINRGAIRGSFLICAFATIKTKEGKEECHLIGHEAVLSRWHVEGCANCQTHLEPKAVFSLHGLSTEDVPAENVDVEIHMRDGLYGKEPTSGSYQLIQNRDSAGMIPRTDDFAAATKRAQQAFQGLRVVVQ